MIKRSSKILLEIVAASVTAILVVGGLLLARLNSGPLSLDFMNSYLSGALSLPEQNITVSIEDTTLYWDQKFDTIGLRALNAKVLNAEHIEVANFPELNIGLSIKGLLFGHIAPARIAIMQPSLTLVRLEDGKFELARNADSASGADYSVLFREIMEALGDPANASSGLRFLEKFEIRAADIAVDDRRTGVTWWAPQSDILLERRDEGVIGEANVRLEMGEKITALDADVLWPKGQEQMVITIHVSDFDATYLAETLPEVAAFTAPRFPITGDLLIIVDKEARIAGFGADIKGGKGKFVLPDYFAEEVPVDSVRIKARYLLDGSVYLEDLKIDLGATTLEAKGKFARDGDKFALTAEGAVENLDMKDLNRLWPKGVAANARAWVVPNIQEGHVKSASASATGASMDGNPANLQIVAADGKIEFSGATVDYFNPLPKATGVDGSATFTKDTFTIHTDGGAVEDVKLGKGEIVIGGLSAIDQDIDISIDTSGPSQTALKIIDHEPLKLPSKRDIKPEQISGDFAMNLRFRFPLLNDLQLEQLAIDGKGDLTNGSYEKAFRGQDLREATLKLNVTERFLDVGGEGKLGGVPLALNWFEDFRSQPEKYRRQYLAKGTADNAARDLFQVPKIFPLDGPIDADLNYTEYDGGKSTLTVEADLAKASLFLPELNYRKEAGVPGKASLAFTLNKGNFRNIDQMKFTAENVAIEGDGLFTYSGDDIDTLNVKAQTPFNDAQISLRQPSANNYTLSIRGNKYDVAYLYSGPKDENKDNDKDSYNIDLQVKELYMGAPQPFYDVKSRMRLVGPDIESMRFDARTLDDKKRTPVVFNILPNEKGRSLSLKTENAGAFLRAADIVASMHGGKLALEGQYADRKPNRPLAARLMITNFNLKDAPIMTKVLSLASLTGALEMLGGNGIGFEKLSANVTMENHVVKVRDGVLKGNSIGANMGGVVDLKQKLFNLEGTLIPAYGVNKAISSIPVIGQIITGGGEQALFAFNFTVKGPLSDPQVGVNPLSALTPGIFREIFGEKDGSNINSAEPVDEPEKKDPPEKVEP